MLQHPSLRKTVRFQSRDCHDETGLIPCPLLITICGARMNLFHTTKCSCCNIHRRLRNEQGERKEDKIVANVERSQAVLKSDIMV